MLDILQGAYKRTKTVEQEHAAMQALIESMAETEQKFDMTAHRFMTQPYASIFEWVKQVEQAATQGRRS